MKNRPRGAVLGGTMIGIGAFLAGCAGGDSVPTPTAISVATSGATAVSATVGGAALSPTTGATPSPGATTSASPSVQPTASAVATPPQLVSGSTAAPQATAAPRATAVALTVRAANLAFDKTAIRVPVGATVTATMQNDDAGQEHNLTFGLPGLPHGDSCKGPCTATQVFKVETAGSYSFLCTIHDMFGAFTVDP